MLVLSLFETKKGTIIVDGKIIEIETKQLLTANLIKDYTNENFKHNIDNFLLNDNFEIKINNFKKINIVTSEKSFIVGTFSNTLEELINELNQEVEFTYILKDLNQDELVINFKEISVIKEEIKEITEEKLETLPVSYVKNNNMYEGSKKIITKGTSKKIKQTFNVVYQDNIEVSRKLISENIVSTGKSKVIYIGTKKIDSTVFEKLANCESGGNWSINTGNGYYGGLQFSKPTWNVASKAVGLNIDYAHNATKKEQILAATWLADNSGFSQWGTCSKKLGLS
ncbi:MAG: transglycosylase family protein [Bacilli bacterium]